MTTLIIIWLSGFLLISTAYTLFTWWYSKECDETEPLWKLTLIFLMGIVFWPFMIEGVILYITGLFDPDVKRCKEEMAKIDIEIAEEKAKLEKEKERLKIAQAKIDKYK